MSDPKMPPLEVVRLLADEEWMNKTATNAAVTDLARWALAVREAAKPLAKCAYEWLEPNTDNERKRIAALQSACTCAGCRLARLIGGDDE